MALRDYLKLVVQTAFKGSLDLAQLLLFVALVFAAIARRVSSGSIRVMADQVIAALGTPEIILSVVAAAVLTRILAAPFLIWRNDQKTLAKHNVPRIQQVRLSRSESRIGYFDLLADTAVRDATAIGDWTLVLSMPNSESRNFSGVIATHGLDHPSLCQLRVGFPYDSVVTDREAVIAAKVVCLRGVDVSGRDIIYAPTIPARLSEAWPDYIENGELRAREHAQYLASVSADQNPTYLLKRLGDAVREEGELRTKGDPADATRLGELEDIKHVAAATLTGIAGVSVGDIFHIAGYAPRVTVTRPDGTLVHDSDWVPEPTQSDPDTEEPPPGESSS